MILIATLLLLTYFPLSFVESEILHIPLRHSGRKLTDIVLEADVASKAQHALPVVPNYNLHGMLGQGYYIELAVGHPEQLVNHIYIFIRNSCNLSVFLFCWLGLLVVTRRGSGM